MSLHSVLRWEIVLYSMIFLLRLSLIIREKAHYKDILLLVKIFQ